LPKTNTLAHHRKTIEHLPLDIRNSYGFIVDCAHNHRRDIDFDPDAKSGRVVRCAWQRGHNKAHAKIHLAYHQRAWHRHCVSVISLRQIRCAYTGSCLCFKNSVAYFFGKFRRVNCGFKSQTSFMGGFFDRVNFDLAGNELSSDANRHAQHAPRDHNFLYKTK
jgi:hypothetical protein